MKQNLGTYPCGHVMILFRKQCKKHFKIEIEIEIHITICLKDISEL